MLVKVCGLTDVKAAREAAIAGVNYIGVLFSNLSPRMITLSLAKEIRNEVRQYGAEVVPVFVDETIEQIKYITSQLDIKIIQLHGDKVRAYCELLADKFQIIYVADNKVIPVCLKIDKDFILWDCCNPKPRS